MSYAELNAVAGPQNLSAWYGRRVGAADLKANVTKTIH